MDPSQEANFFIDHILSELGNGLETDDVGEAPAQSTAELTQTQRIEIDRLLDVDSVLAEWEENPDSVAEDATPGSSGASGGSRHIEIPLENVTPSWEAPQNTMEDVKEAFKRLESDQSMEAQLHAAKHALTYTGNHKFSQQTQKAWVERLRQANIKPLVWVEARRQLVQGVRFRASEASKSTGSCPHGKKSIGFCYECGGSRVCMHGYKPACKKCDGSALCKCGRIKYICQHYRESIRTGVHNPDHTQYTIPGGLGFLETIKALDRLAEARIAMGEGGEARPFQLGKRARPYSPHEQGDGGGF